MRDILLLCCLRLAVLCACSGAKLIAIRMPEEISLPPPQLFV